MEGRAEPDLEPFTFCPQPTLGVKDEPYERVSRPEVGSLAMEGGGTKDGGSKTERGDLRT